MKAIKGTYLNCAVNGKCTFNGGGSNELFHRADFGRSRTQIDDAFHSRAPAGGHSQLAQ